MNLQQLIAMRDTIHFESLTANEMTDNQIKRRKFIIDNIAEYPSVKQLAERIGATYNTIKVDIFYLVNSKALKSVGRLKDIGVKGAAGNGVIYARF